MDENNNLGILKKIIDAVKSEPPKKNKVEVLADILNQLEKENITEETVTELFGILAKSFKEAVVAMEERVANGERGLLRKQEELVRIGEEMLEKWQYLSELEGKGRQMEGSYAQVSQAIQKKMSEMNALFVQLKSIKTSDIALEASKLAGKRLELLIPSIEEIADDLPGNKIKNSLETLKGDERLDKSAIKGLEDEFKKLRASLSTIPRGGSPRTTSYQPMVDDFSALTDGSTKTFYLSKGPRLANAIKVYGTDFPIVLRLNTDFTVANKLLTLTDSVPAPSTGATLICEYYV